MFPDNSGRWAAAYGLFHQFLKFVFLHQEPVLRFRQCRFPHEPGGNGNVFAT